jgi:hypothetical protein
MEKLMFLKKVKASTILNVLTVLLTLTLFGCGSSREALSSWQNGEIKIDGNINEWGTSIQRIPKEGFSVGFKNDNEFLYIGLSTADRTKIFQMFQAGFIVWIEPENSNFKTFGLKYPIAKIPEGGMQMQMPESERSGMGGNKRGEMNGNERSGERSREMPSQMSNDMFTKILEDQNEIQIINKDKYPLDVISLINTEGIDAKLGYNGEKFVYELKIPLATKKHFSLTTGTVPGEKVTIRFETEELSMNKNLGEGGPGGGQEPPSGGGPGGGAPGGGPSGGGRPGGKMSKSNPIDYSFEVNLVKQEAGK